MTTKIYFKAVWIFKDGRNSVSSNFSVDIYEDVFDSIRNTDMEESEHILDRFSSSFRKAFPQFNNKDFKMTAVGSHGEVENIDLSASFCLEVENLILTHKKKCTKAEGAIPLKIVQRRPTQQPVVTTRAITATNKFCGECHGNITGISFRCSQCEDYNMCCICVTSGKHLEHGVVRATDSKVDRDTVAKLRSAPVEIKKEDSTEKSSKKMEGMKTKIIELEAEIKRLVAARSEAMACLARPCDRTSSPENKKRKSESTQNLKK